jgi:hypothetical protein
MKIPAESVRLCVRRALKASFGLTHLYSAMAGTAKARKYETPGSLPPRGTLDSEAAFADLQAEFDKTARAAAQAFVRLVPASKSAVDEAMASYLRDVAGAAGPLRRAVLAAEAHAGLVAAWLRTHPRKKELAVALDAALTTREARLAAAPGAIQSITSADCAAIEMLAAGIESSRGGYMFRGAAERVLADLARADARAPDPIVQMMVGRKHLFRMVRILSMLAEEMDLAAGPHAGDGRAFRPASRLRGEGGRVRHGG